MLKLQMTWNLTVMVQNVRFYIIVLCTNNTAFKTPFFKSLNFSAVQHEEYTSDGGAGVDLLQADLWAEYMDLGKLDKIYTNCKAYMWNEERNKSAKQSTPTFSICCKNGQIKLSEERQPPQFLAYLFYQEVRKHLI